MARNKRRLKYNIKQSNIPKRLSEKWKIKFLDMIS